MSLGWSIQSTVPAPRVAEYRDERENLRRRVRALEEENAALQDGGPDVERLRRRVDTLRSELRQMRRELGAAVDQANKLERSEAGLRRLLKQARKDAEGREPEPEPTRHQTSDWTFRKLDREHTEAALDRSKRAAAAFVDERRPPVAKAERSGGLVAVLIGLTILVTAIGSGIGREQGVAMLGLALVADVLVFLGYAANSRAS